MNDIQRLQALNKRLEQQWNKPKRNMKLIHKLGNQHVALAAKVKAEKGINETQ